MKPKTPISPQLSNRVLSRKGVFVRMGALNPKRVLNLLHSLRYRFCWMWCIWRVSYGSFRGHIQLQRSTKFGLADHGQALELGPNGFWVPVPRTLVRVAYIKNLLAKYPWVDIVDLHIFLMGFDAGEEYVLRTENKEIEKSIE